MCYKFRFFMYYINKKDLFKLNNFCLISIILAKYIEIFFFIKTKSSLYTFIFIFSTISQILKTKFDTF